MKCICKLCKDKFEIPEDDYNEIIESGFPLICLKCFKLNIIGLALEDD